MKTKRLTGILLSLVLILSLAFAGFASTSAGDDLSINCDGCSDDPNYVGYE